MIYRPAQLRYRTQTQAPGECMVQKIALEEHFLSPEYIEPWLPTVAEMPAAKREYLLALPHRLRRAAACLDGQGRHQARGAGGRRPRRAGASATPPRRSATPGRPTISSPRKSRSGRTAIPASRICHAGRQGRRRRARALRQGAEILRRHDQQPHQRAISRPSVAASVLGARRGARHADLSASGRSGVGRAGAGRAIRGCAARPGNGASRPARTRCG